MTLNHLIDRLVQIRDRGTHPLTLVNIYDPNTRSYLDVHSVATNARGQVDIHIAYEETEEETK